MKAYTAGIIVSLCFYEAARCSDVQTAVCLMTMQTSPLCVFQSVTYRSQCQWSEPESWMIWTGWCRCVGASPLCPLWCASCWHQREWAHDKNGCLCPQRVSWALWKDSMDDISKYTFNFTRSSSSLIKVTQIIYKVICLEVLWPI